MSKRDRRVAARTKAAAPAGNEARPGPHAAEEPEPQAEGQDRDEPMAKVIPMKIFDPFAEADKRW